MFPTFCPLTIWAISQEFCRKPYILEADDLLGSCYRKAMTLKKLWTLLTFSPDYSWSFAACFPKENGQANKKPTVHRENQTPKSTNNLRDGVSLSCVFPSFTKDNIWPNLRPASLMMPVLVFLCFPWVLHAFAVLGGSWTPSSPLSFSTPQWPFLHAQDTAF